VAGSGTAADPAASPRAPADLRLASTLGTVVLLGLLAALPAGVAAQSVAEPSLPPAVRVWRTGGLRIETAGLLLSGQQGGDLPIAVLAAPLPEERGAAGATGAARVALRIEVSGPVLLAGAVARPAAGAEVRPTAGAVAAPDRDPAAGPAGPAAAGGRLRLDFAVYALGTTGDLEASIADTVELDLARLAPRLREGGVAFSAGLRLPAGEHSLRVLVRQPEGGAMGLRIVPLVIPAAADAGARLFVPHFPAAAAWVEARAAGAATDVPAALPAARPVLELGQESAFELAALGFPAGEPTLRIELLAAGAVVAELPGGLAPRSGAFDGIERLAARFVPVGVAPGAYELRAVLVAGQDGGGQPRLRSPALPVVVVKGAAGQVWARVERTAPGAGQETAGAGSDAGRAAAAASKIAAGARDTGRTGHPGRPARRQPIEAGPFLASFRRALADFAAGQADTARGEVAALERQLLRIPQATWEDVENLESDALVPLAKANPEALVAVLRLYELLYLTACDERAFDLATHARQMFFGLAEIYPRLSRAAGARQLAARRLAIFAGAMERRCGAGGAAERAFQRAIALDPGYETPRICLAVLAERRGDYRSAVSLLEPVVRDHPDLGEARLRLALALKRSGDERGGRRQLEELVRQRPAVRSWAIAVGYQELARMLLAEDEAAGAETLLREGLGRFPGDEKLGLLLGLVLDAEGKHDAAREVADAIGTPPVPTAVRAESVPPPEVGPRHLYTQLASELLRRDAEEGPASAGERLAALASALAATGVAAR
jgi:tetratricopeptide (TPR) repeat protein